MNVDFIYDFGSPNAYAANKLLAGIEERTGATFNYIPCLLGGIFKDTGNVPPLVRFSEVKGRVAYERLEFFRFAKKHRLTEFKMNSHFPLNTVLTMRGAVAAQMDDVHDAYFKAVMEAIWEKDLKMDDPEVFVQVLTDAGLDGDRLAARTQDADVKDQLRSNTDAAVARGVFGIPTFFVGTEMFFGKDRLDQVEEEINLQSKA